MFHLDPIENSCFQLRSPLSSQVLSSIPSMSAQEEKSRGKSGLAKFSLFLLLIGETGDKDNFQKIKQKRISRTAAMLEIAREIK